MLRGLTHQPLWWIFFATGIYVAAVVVTLHVIGYWRTRLFGEAVLWFVGTALLDTWRAARPATPVSVNATP